MADYVGVTWLLTRTDQAEDAYVSAANPTSAVLSENPYTSALTYALRIWDTGLAAWCYWTATVTTNPTITQTTPNNTGAFLAGSLEIVRVYTT